MTKVFLAFVLVFLVTSSAQSASAQQSHGNVTPDIKCADLDGSYVYSYESPPVYLGFFGSQFAPDSIMNKNGTYGSPSSSLSVRNENGVYGSPFSWLSATNDGTTTPPGIFKRGRLIGFLTNSTLVTPGVALTSIDATCVFLSTLPVTTTVTTDGLYLPTIMN